MVNECKPEIRNTPTHVGKTAMFSLQKLARKKHPHARGEDRHRMARARRSVETPPRTWGRLRGNDKFTDETGNTPTHVGKTQPGMFRG